MSDAARPESEELFATGSAPEDTRSEALKVLAGDWVFWVASLVLVAAAVPYVFPVLDAQGFLGWQYRYADVAVALATLLAVVIGLLRVQASAEQRFWRLVAFAYGAALVNELASAFVPEDVWTVTGKLGVQSLYLVYFVALFLAAAATRGQGTSPGALRLARLRVAGLGIVAFGLILYFDSVPSAAAANDVVPWRLGLYLFAVLDLALCYAFVRAWREQEDFRWRRILAGMAGVSAIFAVLDAAEATLYVEALGSIELPPSLDLAWFLPEALFVVVARLHLADPARSSTPSAHNHVPRTDRGLLVLGLMALPLLHAFLYYQGILDPELRDLREGVVFLFLGAMGVLTLVYLRTLEIERGRGRRELKLSEERYRSFLHAKSDGIYRAEATSVIALNTPFETQLRAAERYLRIAEARDVASRHEPEELIGAPLIALLSPEREEGRRVLESWIEAGYEGEDFEIVEEIPGGAVRYLSGSLTGVIEDGTVVRAWVTISDATEQRLAALETERLEMELEHAQRMEIIGTLAGGIAHDFNNLLQPIMGFTELAKLTTQSDDGQTLESLERVQQASHRAADLVEQILSMSKSRPRREVVFQAQEVVGEALRLIRPSMPATVEIGTAIDDACPPVLGDPSRIHQVLMNLCANASHAIGSGGGRIHIGLEYEPAADSSQEASGWIVLVVQDDGSGIDPSAINRVFEPFYTTRPAGEGTGLGLAVVHGIVTSHGGRVALDSKLGVGTTVTVRLPETDQLGPSEKAEHPTATPSLLVLVVDDEEAVTELTRRLLEAEGHSTAVFNDPGRALDAIKARPGDFDVIVTDQTMPGLTGLDLGRAAKRHNPDLGVVIMSGHHLEPGETDGDSTLLDKPFTSAQLAEALRIATMDKTPPDHVRE